MARRADARSPALAPLLLSLSIAEKLSDKVQIMMVPNDGKFFFANDVLQGMPTVSTTAH